MAENGPRAMSRDGRWYGLCIMFGSGEGIILCTCGVQLPGGEWRRQPKPMIVGWFGLQGVDGRVPRESNRVVGESGAAQRFRVCTPTADRR